MNLHYDAYSSAGIYHSDNADAMVLDLHVFMEEQSALSAQTAPASETILFGVLDGMGAGETGKHASVLAAEALCSGLSTIDPLVMSHDKSVFSSLRSVMR